jgi:adenylyltransferase/sulfurtransferase
VKAAGPVPDIIDVSPRDLARRLSGKDDLQLIDVREKWEWDISRLPGARLVPLGVLEDELDTIDRDRDVVIYCKSGVRSLYAAQLLRDSGFSRVGNLSGGILRWSEQVDPTVVRY